MSDPSSTFRQVFEAVAAGGRQHHETTLLAHAQANAARVRLTLRDLPTETRTHGIVVSAGPSLRRRNSLERIAAANYSGAIIAVDASFVACLRAGLRPDYVLTLDPHPTRVVRWFGDPQWEEHSAGDDYFARQDLDVELRKNSQRRNAETIALVDREARHTKAIVASSAPNTVVDRIAAARMPMYWWNPLVDDPRAPDSLTRALHEACPAPCLNTGGNVGTAAWVFASTTLGLGEVALVGMDFGYYGDTPLEQTQLYYEYKARLGDDARIDDCFIHHTFPLTDTAHYTDPTYAWYAQNFRELLGQSRTRTINCTEGGVLSGPGIEVSNLDDILHAWSDRC